MTNETNKQNEVVEQVELAEEAKTNGTEEAGVEFTTLNTKMAGKNIRKLIAYMKPYMKWIVFISVLTLISSIISVWAPNLIGDIVDYIVVVFSEENLATFFTTGQLSGIDTDAIWNLGRILIILYGVVFVLDFISRFTMTDISQILSKRLRTDLSAKVDRVPLSHFDTEETGNTLSRITNDVGTLQNTVNEAFIAVLSGVAMFVTTLIVMFTVNWIMALTALASAVVGFAFMGISAAKLQKHFKAQQEELGKLTGHVEEVFGAHDIVKTNNAGTFVTKQMREINDRLFTASFKGQFAMSVINSGMGFMMNISLCLSVLLVQFLPLMGRLHLEQLLNSGFTSDCLI